MKWRPISEAPKDGSNIDVWCWEDDGTGYRVADAWWSIPDHRWRCYEDDGLQWKHHPTHFMPPPEPPEVG